MVLVPGLVWGKCCVAGSFHGLLGPRIGCLSHSLELSLLHFPHCSAALLTFPDVFCDIRRDYFCMCLIRIGLYVPSCRGITACMRKCCFTEKCECYKEKNLKRHHAWRMRLLPLNAYTVVLSQLE